MPSVTTRPPALEPYHFHGLQMRWRQGDSHAVADCPLCGREGKFSIAADGPDAGCWRCFVCQGGTDRGGGNALVFLRMLWELSDKATNGQTKVLAADRKLLYPDTLTHWGVVQSVLSNQWLVPGYNLDGQLCQLYKYSKDFKSSRMMLWPTPGFKHHLHMALGAGKLDRTKPNIFLAEGIWDAMASWEVLRHAKEGGKELQVTASETSSLLSTSNVFGIHSCGAVGDSFKKFLAAFAGRNVYQMFDSDHPHRNGEKVAEPAGLAASKRLTKMLADCESPPTTISYVHWGDEGYDPDKKSGYDIRDYLTRGVTPNGDSNGELRSRVAALDVLIRDLVRPVPEAWTGGRKSPSSSSSGSRTHELEPVECRDWATLLNYWRKAMRMRKGLEDVLAAMLAVAVSTEQAGDQQLFLQVIGDPGGGKTRFCDGLLVSKKNCISLEHTTGFHSGWKGDDGEDHSFLARANRKCWVTAEGDVVWSSPKFAEIMSQLRRIFDGTSGASFKNRKEDMVYKGLRTPWIVAGTPEILEKDQSGLGDRFMRIRVDRPDDDATLDILRSVGYSACEAVNHTSTVDIETQMTKELADAYRVTAGYLDYLRENIEALLGELNQYTDAIVERCSFYAAFAADLRAKPLKDPKSDVEASKELPTRLMHQFCRFAKCLAVVLNRGVDGVVLDQVREVSIDTAKGKTLEICRRLREGGAAGLTSQKLRMATGDTPAKTNDLLVFLRKISVCELVTGVSKPGVANTPRWRLTARMERLWKEVMGS